MVEDLIILGAGGTSREVANAIDALNRIAPRWNLLGYLDDDPAKKDAVLCGYPVLGPLCEAREYSAKFIFTLGGYKDVQAGRKILDRLQIEESKFATIIHPSASVSPHSSIGIGSILMQNVVISPYTTLGKHVVVLWNTSIAHDGRVEDHVTIAPGANISGNVRIGASTYIGTGATIMGRITIGEAALVGMGSVVIQDVPAGTQVFGNPARPLMGTSARGAVKAG